MGINKGHYLQKSHKFTMTMHQSNLQRGIPQHCPVGCKCGDELSSILSIQYLG